MRQYYWGEDERRTMVECGYDQTKPDLSSKKVFNQFGKFFHRMPKQHNCKSLCQQAAYLQSSLPRFTLL